ncbi:MAG: aminotransferase class V-fold PLP-dependent enzyme [Planctomycetaceae bacterium]
MKDIASTIRDVMPVARRWAYFDHAAVSPLPEPARLALCEWADHFTENGVVDWSRWRQKIESARALAARRLNVQESEIALVRNTTHGITLVAEGWDWKPGDNVVVPDSEFPSNLYPWMNLADRGVEVRLVPCADGRVEPAAIAAVCNDRTRIVAVSWVGYATGWRADLAALADVAHARGALLFVDAIQGLGVLTLDARDTPIDFLSADGHKWLLGPEGAGVLYVRAEHLDRLRPLGIGWNSVVQAGDFSDKRLRLKADASRYEGGTHNMSGFIGLAASLNLTAPYSSEELASVLREVTDRCCERLEEIGGTVISARDDAHWSGIIACDFPGQDMVALQRACLKQHVVVNKRDGHLRVSPHVYTNPGDIDRLIDALQRHLAH